MVYVLAAAQVPSGYPVTDSEHFRVVPL